MPTASGDEFFAAIKKGETAKVEQLIERDSGLLNSRDKSGMSAVTIAAYYGEPEIAKLLAARGAKLDIFEAAMIGDLGAIEKMVTAEEALVRSYSSDGFTPLHLAAFFGHPLVTEFLIKRHADVNAVAKNTMKVAPLHSASARNQVTVAAMLIRNGADVNARQQNDFTALHSAAQNGNSELVELLLANGGNVNARTLDGRTALGMTQVEGPESGAKQDRERVAKILESQGGIM